MNDILGIHYLLDFYDCNNDYLVSVSKIKEVMIEAGKIGNFNVVKSCFHQFKPYGVSGVLVLKESHLQFIHGQNINMQLSIYSYVIQILILRMW